MHTYLCINIWRKNEYFLDTKKYNFEVDNHYAFLFLVLFSKKVGNGPSFMMMIAAFAAVVVQPNSKYKYVHLYIYVF